MLVTRAFSFLSVFFFFGHSPFYSKSKVKIMQRAQKMRSLFEKVLHLVAFLAEQSVTFYSFSFSVLQWYQLYLFCFFSQLTKLKMKVETPRFNVEEMKWAHLKSSICSMLSSQIRYEGATGQLKVFYCRNKELFKYHSSPQKNLKKKCFCYIKISICATRQYSAY